MQIREIAALTLPARIASLSLLYSFGAMLGLILYGDRLHPLFSKPETEDTAQSEKINGLSCSFCLFSDIYTSQFLKILMLKLKNFAKLFESF